MVSIVNSDQRDQIREMWARNVPVREIARAAGVPKNNMAAVVKAMGLPDRKALPADVRDKISALHKSGYGYRTIMAATGQTEFRVRKHIRSLGPVPGAKIHRTKWSVADNLTFMALWNPAASPDENARIIGAKIGRHPEGVLSKAKMVGLVGNQATDPHRPSAERFDRHAKACLREGGFPAACIRDGKAVWLWPTLARGEEIAA